MDQIEGDHMSKKISFKRSIYLFFSKTPFFMFRKWNIQRKLHVSLLTLIGILGFNAALTFYEVLRLKEYDLNISYLIFLDIVGISCGGLFIWILSKSVIRRMKKMVEQIENRNFVEPQTTYSADEIGELARAVSFMKKTHCTTGEILEEKNRLIQAILDHAVDSIFLFDAKGSITSYSRSFQEAFGYSENEMQDLEINSFIPSIHLGEILTAFSKNDPQKHFYTKNFLIEPKNQKKLQVECSIFPIASKHSDLYVGIIRKQKRAGHFKSFVNKYLKKT